MAASIVFVVGARPNFMKLAPVCRAMKNMAPDINRVIIHTGQHYDDNMSDTFFRDLDIPEPDLFLNVGSATHGIQTGRIMVALEPVLDKSRPELVLVVGDVNSTLAAALVAKKMGLQLGHIEAGLRSFDRSMPEELNRIVTDSISDLLFTCSPEADENLAKEGIPSDKICPVGNVMIDSLVSVLPKCSISTVLTDLGLKSNGYASVTLHRPFNVDDDRVLLDILTALDKISAQMPVVFPVHPRTRQTLTRLQWSPSTDRLRLIQPLGYLDFLKLISESAVVLTDSGGIQGETTYLGIPCLTLRPSTERLITISGGTNRLVKSEQAAIVAGFEEALARTNRPAPKIPLWDGHSAERIVSIVKQAVDT